MRVEVFLEKRLEGIERLEPFVSWFRPVGVDIAGVPVLSMTESLRITVFGTSRHIFADL